MQYSSHSSIQRDFPWSPAQTETTCYRKASSGDNIGQPQHEQITRSLQQRGVREILLLTFLYENVGCSSNCQDTISCCYSLQIFCAHQYFFSSVSFQHFLSCFLVPSFLWVQTVLRIIFVWMWRKQYSFLSGWMTLGNRYLTFKNEFSVAILFFFPRSCLTLCW